jgi:hypothetical protein
MQIRNIIASHEVPEDNAGASALGTGETPDPGVTPPAGESNTDTGDGGTPDTIPYSRFKEVNDAYGELRQYEGLASAGYDADSLRQLAEFEAGFRTDPVQTWMRVAANIEDLPPEVAQVIQQHMGAAPAGKPEGTPPAGQEDEQMPEWARKLQEKTDTLLETEQQRQTREQTEASDRLLNGIMDQWKKADQADDMDPLDERKMLTYIVAHARGAGSPEQILEAARKEYLDTREFVLGSTVKPGTGGGVPRTVPSGGAPANGSPEPKTLAEASKRALARLSQEG